MQRTPLLAEALALWRGPPLADFAYEAWAQPPIGRLEGLRLSAVEDQNEAELACGRHGELVPELEALVEMSTRYVNAPRAHLMLALYRGGTAGRGTRALSADATVARRGARHRSER